MQIRTIYTLYLPMMLHNALGRKWSGSDAQSNEEDDSEDENEDDDEENKNSNHNVRNANSNRRVDNNDKQAHQLLFILLGQVIQLLCVRRLTRASLDIAFDILRAYNTLFALCFPNSCVYNQHFNGSHLKG